MKRLGLFSSNVPPLYGIILGVLIFGFSGLFTLLGVKVISSIIKLIGLSIIFFHLIKKNTNFVKPDKSIRILFTLFIIWQLFIISRGYLIGNVYFYSYDQPITSFGDIIRLYLFNPNYILHFFIPLVVLIKFDIREFSYLRILAFLICVVQLILIIYFYRDIFIGAGYRGLSTINNRISGEELTIRSLYAGISFGLNLILTYALFFKYLPKYLNFFTVTCLLINTIAQIISGGRGDTVTAFIYLVMLLFLFSISSGRNNRFLLSKGILASFILLLIYFLFKYLYEKTSIFDYLVHRTFLDVNSGEFVESNRSYLVSAFISDFNQHPLDWLIGRGINGIYYTPSFLGTSYRTMIEYGFLDLILKGGLINLFFYIWFFFISFRKAFFRSKNFLCKAIGLLLFWQIISLVPYGRSSFSVGYVLAWWFVGLVNQESFCQKTDYEIEELFYC